MPDDEASIGGVVHDGEVFPKRGQLDDEVLEDFGEFQGRGNDGLLAQLEKGGLGDVLEGDGEGGELGGVIVEDDGNVISEAPDGGGRLDAGV